MKDWKTTTLGILTIVGGLANAGVQYYTGKPVNLEVLVTSITAGWGLIQAKDATPAGK